MQPKLGRCNGRQARISCGIRSNRCGFRRDLQTFHVQSQPRGLLVRTREREGEREKEDTTPDSNPPPPAKEGERRGGKIPNVTVEVGAKHVDSPQPPATAYLLLLRALFSTATFSTLEQAPRAAQCAFCRVLHVLGVFTDKYSNYHLGT